ncbi:DUF4855 domain-containing protein [Thermococcus sp. M36]|uniref:DUF4855 domain-containing protein n=1 Tax=Thermococcus sp. M36 TaxID=1638261 RepID=UPI001439216F|nr:DUF4855 domain-containing protein [Thermococcus sp. M36]NJE05574.1 DUF4855 domain-containing protein [Thermococcus sp. M36]
MSRFSLWWIIWNGSEYDSRMTFEGKKLSPSYKVVNAFKDRGFDRVVFLDSEGKEINYTGNGRKDGASLALWISSRVSGLKYYVPIPFYKYGSGEPRDDPSDGFANSYWKDWIDGVLSIVDSDRLGFYWSYESCLQATPHDEHNVREEFVREMAEYIHNHGQELIWIPATGGRGVSYLNDPNYDGIPTIGGYFDYVFVQPNYYEYDTCIEETNGDKQTLSYTYEKLVEKVRWVYEELPKKIKEHNPNSTTTVSMEMEADRAVLPDQCGHCALGCDTEKCIERACDYYKAILEVNPSAFSTRAYYSDVDFKVIDMVRGKCPDW